MSIVLPQTAANPSCAQSFLAEVFKDCADGFVNIFHINTSEERRSFSIPIEEAVSADWAGVLGDLRDEHVYFQITPIGREPPEYSRGNAEDAIALTGFFADLDFLHPNKDVTALPRNADEALAMFAGLDAFMAPTLVASTGRGLHGYWLLDEPFDLRHPQVHAAATALNKAFGVAFRDDAFKRFAWEFDSISDLARLGRLPGSYNVKENPAPMVTWSFHGHGQRYNINDVIDELQRRGVAIGPARQQSASRNLMPFQHQNGGPWKTIFQTEREWLNEHVEAKSKIKLPKTSQPGQPQARQPMIFLPNAAAMAVGCGWMTKLVDEPEAVPYGDWFASINLLNRCDNGEALAHAVSAPHPKYTKEETDAKLKEVDGVGALTCRHVENDLGSQACKTCPFKTAANPIKSPLELGIRGRSSDYVNVLKRTVFVVSDGLFFDLDDTDAELARDGLSKEAFRDRHAHPPVSLSSADFIIADPLLPKAEIRRFDPARPAGVSFLQGQRVFNEYEPPSVKPAAGDVAAFLALVDRVFGEHAGHALSYFAHLHQKPWVKITHGILVQSKQGLGKGSLFNILSGVLGRSNCQTVDNNVFDDGYWARMAKRVLLLINEVQAEDKVGVYNALKSVMADEDFDAKEKYVKARRLMSPRGVLVFSNKPVPMKIEDDDRRFYVLRRLDVPPAPEGSFAPFFSPSQEFLAAIAHFLSNYDISAFDPKATPPMTDAKRALIDASHSRLEEIVRDAVEAQEGPFRFPVVGNRWIEGWLSERLSGWTRPALKEALLKLNVTPLKDNKQQRCPGADPYEGPQRFWVVRDHDFWMDKDSIEVRDEFVKLCKEHNEPCRHGAEPVAALERVRARWR